jgi:hypothetical protein
LALSFVTAVVVQQRETLACLVSGHYYVCTFYVERTNERKNSLNVLMSNE